MEIRKCYYCGSLPIKTSTYWSGIIYLCDNPSCTSPITGEKLNLAHWNDRQELIALRAEKGLLLNENRKLLVENEMLVALNNALDRVEPQGPSWA